MINAIEAERILSDGSARGSTKTVFLTRRDADDIIAVIRSLSSEVQYERSRRADDVMHAIRDQAAVRRITY